MLKHEGIPVKLMAGIPFCREIIHQEIKVKKTIILTLLLITALVANGCGNKKNVTDMKDKETTVSAVQQETTQLRTQETTTGLTMDSETQQEETTEEESKNGFSHLTPQIVVVRSTSGFAATPILRICSSTSGISTALSNFFLRQALIHTGLLQSMQETFPTFSAAPI